MLTKKLPYSQIQIWITSDLWSLWASVVLCIWISSFILHYERDMGSMKSFNWLEGLLWELISHNILNRSTWWALCSTALGVLRWQSLHMLHLECQVWQWLKGTVWHWSLHCWPFCMVEETLDWCPCTNSIIGLCCEHSLAIPHIFNNIDDAHTIFDDLANKKVHWVLRYVNYRTSEKHRGSVRKRLQLLQ